MQTMPRPGGGAPPRPPGPVPPGAMMPPPSSMRQGPASNQNNGVQQQQQQQAMGGSIPPQQQRPSSPMMMTQNGGAQPGRGPMMMGAPVTGAATPMMRPPSTSVRGPPMTPPQQQRPMSPQQFAGAPRPPTNLATPQVRPPPSLGVNGMTMPVQMRPASPSMGGNLISGPPMHAIPPSTTPIPRNAMPPTGANPMSNPANSMTTPQLGVNPMQMRPPNPSMGVVPPNQIRPPSPTMNMQNRGPMPPRGIPPVQMLPLTPITGPPRGPDPSSAFRGPVNQQPPRPMGPGQMRPPSPSAFGAAPQRPPQQPSTAMPPPRGPLSQPVTQIPTTPGAMNRPMTQIPMGPGGAPQSAMNRPMTQVPPTGQAGPPRPMMPGGAPIPMMPGGAPVPAQTMNRMQAPPPPPRNPRPSLVDVLSPPTSPPIVIQSTQTDPQTGLYVPFPPASTSYVCSDTGHSSCRFMRPCSRLIPCSSSMVDELRFPLAIACTPFGGDAVAMSEWVHEQGPIRCSRCKGYLNCFVKMSHDFSRWECSLCAHENETPSHYKSFAAGTNGLSELRFGSVEFDVPDVFFGDRTQARANFLFVADATAVSIRSGLFSYALRTVLTLAQSKSYVGEGARIGIVTFDESSVFFYEMNEDASKPRVLISGDCDEGFSPLPSSSMLIPQAQLEKLNELIHFILANHSASQQPNDNKQPQENISGAALMSAYSCLKEEGGKVILITSSICNKGVGKLTEREQPSMVGSDQEQVLYTADKEEKFYNELSLRCLQASVAVDAFVCGAEFVDAAALVQVTSTTGGSFERIPHFSASNPLHRQQLDLCLRRTVSTIRALSTMMKARTSSGLKVARYLGHGFMEETSFRVSSMSTDYCLCVELEHDGTKLEDSKSRAIVQFAILYVDVEGRRRLRVHNLALQAKESPSLLLGSLDPVAVALYQAKSVSLDLAESTVNKVRDSLTRRVCDWTRVMSKHRPMYRGGDSFDLITMYVNSIFKSPALLLNRPLDRGVREPYARADARILSRFRWLAMTPERFSLQAYPALVDLTSMTPENPTFTRVPCSSEFLRPDGMFLLSDGSEQVWMFLGARVNPAAVEQVLGVIPSPELKVALVAHRPAGSYPLSSAVFHAVQTLLTRFVQTDLSSMNAFAVNIANGAVAEFFAENRFFLEKLVEDKLYAEQSYNSFVTHVYQVMESSKG